MKHADSSGTADVSPLSEEVERRILDAVRAISYGSVEIVIHDSKVVQIERREKVRFGSGSPRGPTL